MSKYYGAIGYAERIETSPDVWVEEITERNYVGDLIRNQRRWEPGEGLNDNTNIENVISIVADPYALDSLSKIRYITFMGAKWKVRSIDVQYPRLNLTIGGVYNDQTPAVER